MWTAPWDNFAKISAVKIAAPTLTAWAIPMDPIASISAVKWHQLHQLGPQHQLAVSKEGDQLAVSKEGDGGSCWRSVPCKN